MRPILDLIAEREAAATATVRALREQIAKLTDEVALADKELAELVITRKTLMTLTGTAEATTPVDATIASAAYQKILTAFATATDPMRAKDVCLALGLGVTAKDTGGIRAKLKRLVARHILVETQPVCSPSRQRPRRHSQPTSAAPTPSPAQAARSTPTPAAVAVAVAVMRHVGASARSSRWPPPLGQGAALPRLGPQEADLPVTEGRHTAATVAVPARTAGTGQVTQRRPTPLATLNQQPHIVDVSLLNHVTKHGMLPKR